jgi:uncharacterized protein with GYD domain
MPTFVMLTRLAPTAVHSPDDLKTLETKAVAAVKEHCPAVEWKANFALLGPYDYLDVFDAPDLETATKVSVLIRTVGHAHTEVWPATPWQRFKQLISDIQTTEEREPVERASVKVSAPQGDGLDRGVLLHDVAAALGDGDESVIAEIMVLNPTYEEFEIALAYAQGESDVMGEERHPLEGKAKQVYDILTAAEAWQDEAEAQRG